MTDNILQQGTLICVDWGSSNFRAFLLDENGGLVDSIYFDKGMLEIKPNEFEPTLFDLLKYWPKVPIILAGMVGSLNGWQNTKYVSCPVKVEDLSAHLTHIANAQNRQVSIVSGIDTKQVGAQYDVARGEETQIFGAMQLLAEDLSSRAVFCLPGTHSKWVHVVDKAIVGFSTHMTGELFDILIKHSILAPKKIVTSDLQNDEMFLKGVTAAKANGGLAHHIFSARTNMINGEIRQNEVPAYLSGILIGTEIKEMLQSQDNVKAVYLVGNKKLNDIYEQALKLFNVAANKVDGEKAAYTGMYLMAKQAGF